MESTKNFSEELEHHIAVQREEFNRHLLPQVQQDYAALGSVVKILRSNLLKKGLVYDDPYKYDSRMTEIKVPSNEAFADSERAAIVGSRLAQYQTMLEFLTNSYQFNCSFLTPQRIAAMLALNKTFQWSALNENSTLANTRAIAEICKSLHSVSDTLTGGLLRDSLGHLSKLDNSINKTLRQLARLHREEYKLTIRENLPPDLTVTQADIASPIKLLKTIKKAIAAKDDKLPFYHELVMEVIREDYSSDSEHLQREVLRHLNVVQKENVKTNKQENMRPVLITGLRILGTTGNHFDTCLTKLMYNQEIVYKAHTTIFTKLVEALRRAFNMEEKKHEITISIKDPINNLQKKEIIILEDFTDNLAKTLRIFKVLASGTSDLQQRLTGMSNEQLLELLNKYIVMCNGYLKTLSGLDDYYKSTDIILRSKMKGIKIELTTIRNAVIKANQCRAEYNASVEEYSNMKELGLIHE